MDGKWKYTPLDHLVQEVIDADEPEETLFDVEYPVSDRDDDPISDRDDPNDIDVDTSDPIVTKDIDDSDSVSEAQPVAFDFDLPVSETEQHQPLAESYPVSKGVAELPTFFTDNNPVSEQLLPEESVSKFFKPIQDDLSSDSFVLGSGTRDYPISEDVNFLDYGVYGISNDGLNLTDQTNETNIDGLLNIDSIVNPDELNTDNDDFSDDLPLI